jgi:hypothetical protein
MEFLSLTAFKNFFKLSKSNSTYYFKSFSNIVLFYTLNKYFYKTTVEIWNQKSKKRIIVALLLIM